MSNILIRLLPNTKYLYDQDFRVLVLGEYPYIAYADVPVEVQSATGEVLGTAEIKAVHAGMYTYLDKADFVGMTNPRMLSYSECLNYLTELVPGFSMFTSVTSILLTLKKNEHKDDSTT